MNLEFIDNSLNKKIIENEEIIVYTYYELRIKANLSKNDTNCFIKLVSIKLQNLNYSVYRTGERYLYNNIEKLVQDNELLVAVKE